MPSAGRRPKSGSSTAQLSRNSKSSHQIQHHRSSHTRMLAHNMCNVTSWWIRFKRALCHRSSESSSSSRHGKLLWRLAMSTMLSARTTCLRWTGNSSSSKDQFSHSSHNSHNRSTRQLLVEISNMSSINHNHLRWRPHNNRRCFRHPRQQLRRMMWDLTGLDELLCY